MPTIPASQLVSVNPDVLAAGGEILDVIALILTTSTRAPIGSVLSFSSVDAVSAYFGASAPEVDVARTYFAGFTGSSRLPGSVLFAQYNSANVAAFIRGGDVSALTLTQLQAITGSLNIVIDGNAFNAASVNLAAATGFSSAAGIIQTALNAAALTGIASFTGSISGTTLTVASGLTGTVSPGDVVDSSGADAVIVRQLTGTSGGLGTYETSVSQTVGSGSMTTKAALVTVSYDSVSGGFVITSGAGASGQFSTIAYATGTIADDLKLQAAQNAVLSQGADAAVPATFMDALVAVEDGFATFMTMFDPDVSGFAVKEALADWNGGKNDRYAYVCFDVDSGPAAAANDAGCLAAALANSNNSGTCLIWASDAATGITLAAFVCGAAASINFDQTNGRITFAYKQQSGIEGDVTDGQAAINLGGNPQTVGDRGNGYNFYGAYGTANADFIFFQRGFVTGDFAWLDSYINQIWMNNLFQVALLSLLSNALSVPFSVDGDARIEASLSEAIDQARNFRAFEPAAMTASQIVAVNADAGRDISNALQTQGYYLLVTTASTAVRNSRGPRLIKFYYLDRGSVQSINLSSVAVQ